MKYFSMFTGVGGFEIGINKATNNKWECIGFSEIDKYCNQLLKYKFPNTKNYGNATAIKPRELPDFDLLCGGFPCQTFSIAGKRRGFEDSRGTLFFEIARILEAKRPKIVLLENVKGLLNHDKGKTIKTILHTLNNLGYYINLELYNSKHFGVPQNRERVFLICNHITDVINDGTEKKMILLKQIIEQYLFQLLLNNLKEVAKLQEIVSKDSILNYLICKEIKQNFRDINLKEPIKDGQSILTEENKFESMEDMWQNTEKMLKTIWEEDCLEQNKFTISTVTKQITELKTYTYSLMLLNILTAIVQLRNSSNRLWRKILSNLIVIKEGMRYATIINENEERFVTDGNNSYKSEILRNREHIFIIGSIRGQSRPEILPIGECNGKTKGMESKEKVMCYDDYNHKFRKDDVCGTVRPTFANKATGNGCKIIYAQKSDREIARVYSTEGISPTLHLKTGGWQEPKIQVAIKAEFQKTTYDYDGISPTIRDGHGDVVRIAIPVLTPDRLEKRQNGRRFKENGEPSFTLTGQDKHGVAVLDCYSKKVHTDRTSTLTEPHHNLRIRKLTPIECERLQGFPDNWTKYGINEKDETIEISDTQRYKMMGNAVTTNVIEAIIKELITKNEKLL